MSNLANIRTAIRDILSSIPETNNVYDHDRTADGDWKRFLDLFRTSQDNAEGWLISRTGVQTQFNQIYRKKQRAHIFTIKGFMQFNDALVTEHIFNNVVENVESVFDINQTLNDTCETTYPTWGIMEGSPGLVVDSIGFLMYGNVLVHLASCRLCAVEKIE